MVSHDALCDLLGVERSLPAPHWRPYAVMLRRITVRVEGEPHPRCWGGGMKCGRCGYGIDIRPEGDACPRCGYNGKDIGAARSTSGAEKEDERATLITSGRRARPRPIRRRRKSFAGCETGSLSRTPVCWRRCAASEPNRRSTN